MKRQCPHCSRPIQGHQNKRFCGSKCKDRYHNALDPKRQRFLGSDGKWRDEIDDHDPSWDGHKSA